MNVCQELTLLILTVLAGMGVYKVFLEPKRERLHDDELCNRAMFNRYLCVCGDQRFQCHWCAETFDADSTDHFFECEPYQNMLVNTAEAQQ